MGIVVLVACITVLLMGSIRWMRWLAIVQQKEYRLDRIILFLLSIEGIKEALHVIPLPQEFSRTGLKRPKPTSRIITVMVISIGLSVLTFFAAWIAWVTQIPLEMSSFVVPLIILVIMHIFQPIIVLVSAVPTVLIALAMTRMYLIRARRVLEQSQPIIIGITGSYGKTSTRQLLVKCIGEFASVFSPPRSYNTKLGVANSILAGYHNQKYVVLEFGAYAPGEIAELASYFVPQLVMLTGFAPQHFGLFGSEENIARAKAELVLAAPPNAPVFYNADDSGVRNIIEAAARTDMQYIPYEQTYGGQWRFPRSTAQGFTQFDWGDTEITTRMIGTHYLTNMSGAASVAAYFGANEQQLQNALIEYQPADHVIRLYRTENDITILDDGETTNSVGFSAALKTMASLPLRPKYLITAGIIDLGKKSQEVHAILAEEAAASIDGVLYVGEEGLSTFQKRLGAACVSDRSAVLATIAALPPNCVLCIEGKMPPWVKAALDALG